MDPTFADLGKTEQDVMVQLAQQRTTSLVALGASLWRTTPDWKAFDPFPMLTFVVESLCDKGLLKFRLAHPYGAHRGKEEPTDIRLTQSGWSLMGYARYIPEVGSSERHKSTPLHTTDGTNYRNHHPAAQGGEIEVDDFPTHKANYPHHVHMYNGDMMSTAPASETGDMTRNYTRVTPEMEAKVIAARASLGTAASYKEIEDLTGVPARTARYIITQLPELRRMKGGDAKAQGSLKARIIQTVDALGFVKDVAELRSILGMADSDHDVVHVLHSLHTQGKIDFIERGNGMGTATVVNIRPQKKGRASLGEEALSQPAQAAVEPEATTPEDPTSSSSAPEPEEEGYPLLTELLGRERDRVDADKKALAYIEAAEAIQQVDPEASAELMAKSLAFAVMFPSPIEREYLRYVLHHTNADHEKGL